MYIKKISTPIQFLSLAKVKDYLAVTFDDSDDLIKRLFDQATTMVENQTGKCLRETDYELWLNLDEIKSMIPFPYTPVDSISLVRSFDSDDSYQDITNYFFNSRLIYFKNPPTPTRLYDALLIKFKIKPIDPPPQDLVQAILDLTQYFFDNRGVPEKKIPLSVAQILAQHKPMAMVI